jgi:hypothetical protein
MARQLARIRNDSKIPIVKARDSRSNNPTNMVVTRNKDIPVMVMLVQQMVNHQDHQDHGEEMTMHERIFPMNGSAMICWAVVEKSICEGKWGTNHHLQALVVVMIHMVHRHLLE